MTAIILMKASTSEGSPSDGAKSTTGGLIDKGFDLEHDLKKLSFGITVVTAAKNQMPSYERLLEELVRQIEHVSPGAPGSR